MHAASIIRRLTTFSALAGLMSASSAPAQSVADQAVRKGQAVIVMDGECARNGVELAPIIAVGASFAAKFLVGWVGNALEARKAGLTGQFVAGGVIEKDPVDAACLRIYRGPIGKTGVPRGPEAIDSADFLLDADIKVAADTKVWTVAPVRLVYRASSARTASATKHVSVVIALTESRPADGAKPDAGQPIAIFRHDFGELKLRSAYAGGTLEGTGSASAVGDHKALNVTALVTESAEAGPALTALLGAFTQSKDKLTDALTDVIKGAAGGEGK